LVVGEVDLDILYLVLVPNPGNLLAGQDGTINSSLNADLVDGGACCFLKECRLRQDFWWCRELVPSAFGLPLPAIY